MADTYKIGEAAALLNLKTYVLRFWETEFPDVIPLRTGKGQRLYTVEHLALLERIRYLLHERGLTIGGARKILAEEKERGVSYVFDPSGTGTAEENRAEPDILAVPEQGGLSGNVRHAVLSSPGEPNYDSIQEDDGPPPWARVREQSGRGLYGWSGEDSGLLSQYNLPGIARAFPDKKAFMSRPETEDTADNGLEAPAYAGEQVGTGSALDDPRMLPLFSVARPSGSQEAKRHTAPAQEVSAGPPVEGGSNFIHTGAPSLPQLNQETEKQLRDALAARREAEEALKQQAENTRSDLLGILVELKSISALLRK